jgi:hypothetical protein
MGRYPCWIDVFSYFICGLISLVGLMQGRNHPSTQIGLLGKLGVKFTTFMRSPIEETNMTS